MKPSWVDQLLVSFIVVSLAISIAPVATAACTTNSSLAVTVSANIFTSTNHPSNYLINENCGWTLTASTGYAIEIIISSLTIDQGGGDYYAVYDLNGTSSSLVIQTYAQRSQIKIVSRLNKLFFKFKSDTANVGTGFNVSYRQVNATGLISGYIQNLNYKRSVFVNEIIDWSLNGQPGNIFLLGLSIDRNSESPCLNPLQITSSGQIIYNATKGFRDYAFQTTNSDISVHFVAGCTPTVSTGFQLNFYERPPLFTKCSGLIKSITGSANGTVQIPPLNSAGFYNRLDNCSWMITVSPGYSISLTLVSAVMPSSQTATIATPPDTLYIYDGPDIESRLIFQTNASYSIANIVTTSNSAFLYFAANTDMSVGTGYVVTYAQVPSTSTFYGYVKTATEPIKAHYLPYQTSGWGIKTNPGQNITFVATNKGVEACCDYITLFDSPFGVFASTITKMQTLAPSSYQGRTSSSSLSATFFSDRYAEYDGFVLNFNESVSLCATRPCQNGGTCIAVNTCSCRPQWTGPNCTNPVCSNPVCYNGGTCVQPNVCSCTSSWTGIGCSTPTCTNNPCLYGNCSAPNTCTCWWSNFTGPACSTPVCSPSCANGGNCTAPNVCNCPNGWTGTTCQTAICSGGCIHGNCNVPNVCTCTSGWSGINCNSAICNPACIAHSDCVGPNTCSCSTGWNGTNCSSPICASGCGNGNCISPGTCNCNPGWTGFNCSTPICSSGCGHGKCISPSICQCNAGWTGADCSIATCSQNCSNGGGCVAPDTCLCAAGWTGSNCTKPTCSPSCQNGGACSAPNTCTCPTGYNGTSCQFAICLGGCVHGNCTVPNVCTCASGWSGNNCNSAICSGGCIHGNCNAPNVCTCTSGWSGINCNSAICNPACIAHSDCVGPNTCSCSTGWNGTNCSSPICASGCGNGNCISPGTCNCNPGWTGSTCSTPICNPVCSAHGSCTGPNVCTCSSGWSSITCNSPICANGCGNGNCISPGTCACNAGWTGSTCSTPTCSPSCQNGGACSAPNTCTCPTGYNGTSCQFAICLGGCVHGNCAVPNVCTCASGWSGNNCNSAICNPGCSGNGNCAAPNTCSCSAGWTGNTCTSPICAGGCGHGNCISPGTCSCNAGWTGSSCSSAICSQTCANNGACSAPNTCTCASGWTGSTCNLPYCSVPCVHGNCTAPNTCTCDVGWTGSACQTPICNNGCAHGNCVAPGVCTCSSGWIGTTCNIAICNSPCINGNCTAPDVCSCISGWTGATCKTPTCNGGCQNNGNCTAVSVCSCSAGWSGPNCDSAICNQLCENGGVCTSPNVCTCVIGWHGPICENSTTVVTTKDIVSMTDGQLAANSKSVGAAVSKLAQSVSLNIRVPAVIDLLSTMDIVLNRLANRTDFVSDDFQSLAEVFCRASDALMKTATNESDSSVLDPDSEDTSKCKLNSHGEATFIPQSIVPVLSKDQLRTIFNSFMNMIVNMFTNLRAVLRPGTNMTFTGQFYGAVVFNLLLKDLPGLKLATNLANVEFDHTNSPYDLIDSFPANCPNLQPSDMVHLVLSAFVVNTLSDKQFNMPTVTVRLYCQVQAELTLNANHPILVTGIPSVRKAQLFATQERNAQCEISKSETVKCDLSGNVDHIGSVAKFPLALNAGDFVLIFPIIDFPYRAYISFTELVGLKSSDWMAYVTKTDVSVNQNSKYPSPRNFYNTAADLRIIIPQAAIDQYSSTLTKSSSPVAIYVYMKREFSAFSSLDNLPMSACDLQRCYGYHLKLGFASDQMNQGRRRRSLSYDDGFELEPSSNESAVTFKSSYFGDFGADLVISPNTIEFTDIFANFSALVAENSAVLAFQVLAIVLFIVGIVFAFKFDHADLKEWAFLSIISNQPFYKAKYLISVDHSRVKHFQLGPKVSIRLLGKEQDTVWRLLEDGIRKNNFAGKHPANFTLSSQMDIGQIEAIELRLESKTESPKNLVKMNVDRVTVVDLQQGHKFIFLLKSTIQQGQEVTAELASEDEMKGYTYLVTGHSRTSFTEIHPWLSIAQRPLPSNWTRCERLGCVMAAIFMAMLVNAMFYGKEASAPSVGLRVGRWFTISWFTVWTSFIGCLVVIPPTAIIAFIFKRVTRKSAERSEWKTVFNLAIETKKDREHLVDENEPKKKLPFILPFYCVIIAWSLVALCTLTSAALVVFYSLSWGQEKSLQWLSGMIISVIQDIILIQPIKVILSAIFSATIHTLPADGVDLGTLVYHQKTNKKKLELFYRLRAMVTAICHHIVYVIVFSCVVSAVTNRYAYIQIKSLEPLIALPNIDQCTGTINDYQTIFSWLNTTVLYNVQRANKLEQRQIYPTASMLYSVRNPNIALLGSIRIRQQRVSQATCEIRTQLGRIEARQFDQVLGSDSVECQQVYSNNIGIGTSSEKRHFNNSWLQPLNQGNSFNDIYNISSDIAPWIYRETDGPPYAGWEASYKTGGYFVDLPKKLADAQNLISQLHHQRWLDNATTVFFVEFNLFNMQTNLFIPVKIVFEALSAGGISYHIRLFPLQLYQYSGANSTLVFLVQGLYVILLISHLVRIILGIKKQRFREYFKNGWNCLDAVQIGLGFGIIGLFAARIYCVINAITKIQTMRMTYTNLDMLANWEDLIFSLLGIQFFMIMILFFRHLSVNKHWAVLLATLSKGKQTLLLYTALFASATILFAAIAYLIMGFTFQSFSSFTRAIMSLIQWIIGTVDFNGIKFSRFYLFLMMAYNSVVVFVGGNFFVTMILASHREVVMDIENQTDWDSDLSEFVSQSVREILANFSRKKKHSPDSDLYALSDVEKESSNDLVEALGKIESYLGRSDKHFKCEMTFHLEMKSLFVRKPVTNCGESNKRRSSKQIEAFKAGNATTRWKDVLKRPAISERKQLASADVVRRELYGKTGIGDNENAVESLGPVSPDPTDPHVVL